MLGRYQFDWDDRKIEDFLSLRLTEAETRTLLAGLTPNSVDATLFERFVLAMRKKALPIKKPQQKILDCCGTGGSGLPRFNTSTASAFVMAAGGVPVVKFGNRAATSKSGSFDLLELLQIPPTWPLQALHELLEICNLVFLYAPQVYAELKDFMNLRRILGVPTIFNSMGPLLNPLDPAYRVLGVSNPLMQDVIAMALSQEQFNEKSWVVRAESGLDELVSGENNRILEVMHRSKSQVTINTPKMTGQSSSHSHTPEENLILFQNIVSAKDRQSIHYHNTCLNAAAGFVVTGKTHSFDQAVVLAQALLKEGVVQESVQKVQATYQKLSRYSS